MESQPTTPYLILKYHTKAKMTLEFVFDHRVFFVLQYIQKKNPNYEEMKNDTVWSIDKLYEYIYETYGEDKKLSENIGKVIDVRVLLHSAM